MARDVFILSVQRNHSLFGTVKALQQQKSAMLPSNGVRSSGLPVGVPRLVIPGAPSSEQTEASDEIPPHVPARYQLSLNRSVAVTLLPTTLVVLVK